VTDARTGRLAGQVALVTGASRGIGEALARSGRREGMRLVLSARGREPLEALARELDPSGKDVLALAGDVSDRAHAESLVKAAEDRFGTLDVLINNAGLAIGGKIADTRPEDVELQVRVNFLGAYYCTRYALPGMISRKRGHVVFMASVAGLKYSPGGSIYSATKFALRSLAEALRNEVQEHNIKVTAIYPGITATTYFDPRNPAALAPPIPLEKMLTSADVAEATLSVLGLPDRVSISQVVLRPTVQER
jgi:NADP-dependent 3-hydroxy acid dehydrogenase YdfG